MEVRGPALPCPVTAQAESRHPLPGAWLDSPLKGSRCLRTEQARPQEAAPGEPPWAAGGGWREQLARASTVTMGGLAAAGCPQPRARHSQRQPRRGPGGCGGGGCGHS